MGEYFNWVNIDKKEYLHPFDGDVKSLSSSGLGGPVLRALNELLFNQWRGDRIIFLGDYFELPEDSHGVFKTLAAQVAEVGLKDSNHWFNDFVEDHYRDISCLFKAGEADIRRDLEYALAEYRKNNGVCDDWTLKRYGVDPNNPFDGLFLKEGRDCRFRVNYTKKLYYSPDSIKFFRYKEELDRCDPLPLLMACGNTEALGPWVGDIIGVSDEIPDGFELLKEVCFDDSDYD